MAQLSKEDVKSYLRNATMMEISELVKELEEEFGVSAAMAVAPVAAASPAAAGAAPAEEKTSFDVILKSAGAEKIKAIKVVREVTSLGLKEAKELVESIPKPVKEGATKEEAEAIRKKFEEVGASVEVK